MTIGSFGWYDDPTAVFRGMNNEIGEGVVVSEIK